MMKRSQWKWESNNQYLKVQTKREDQGACTPNWLLSVLEQTWGKFYDPCPHTKKAQKKKDGLSVDWHSVNYINPPFTKAKEWLEKGKAESKKGKHCVFLLPANRMHRSYFASVFTAVTAVEVLSKTIAFQGYDKPLPHALMLVHMGDRPSLQTKQTYLHIMKVPDPSSFEQVRQMVKQHGYPCYVLDNSLTNPLQKIMDTWAKHRKPMAILFPARLECRVVHSHVLSNADGLYACVGCLRPSESLSKVWSPSILAVFGKGSKDLNSHPWVSSHKVPVFSYNVDTAMQQAAGTESHYEETISTTAAKRKAKKLSSSTKPAKRQKKSSSPPPETPPRRHRGRYSSRITSNRRSNAVPVASSKKSKRRSSSRSSSSSDVPLVPSKPKSSFTHRYSLGAVAFRRPSLLLNGDEEAVSVPCNTGQDHDDVVYGEDLESKENEEPISVAVPSDIPTGDGEIKENIKKHEDDSKEAISVPKDVSDLMDTKPLDELDIINHKADGSKDFSKQTPQELLVIDQLTKLQDAFRMEGPGVSVIDDPNNSMDWDD
eukprot:NODE_1214_length_2067_cov_38.418724_g1023_i0.p1 GENE.NODE_1214_length_2067_cov_38.418724_g1023_i0~~NODE_1214_length_2067_cov_38.418724_g1023_i0.p1  ORF type:complete len:599 (+),score=121.16 NODE_1214_length_2067_cov_38.418724_g1023_i0:171-1799(+)